jgi:hypothetical protein
VIGVNATKVIFDARAVTDAASKAEKKVLGRQGAYVRGVAKRSIRLRQDRKLKSPPGGPPYTHTGALKRAVAFAVEAPVAVVGPTRNEVGLVGKTHEFGGVERKTKSARRPNWKLELGGHGPLRVTGGEVAAVGQLRTQRQVNRAKRLAAMAGPAAGAAGGERTRTYPPRPFMGPALETARPKLAQFWADSIRR